jgi:trimeric autotransporter adhesin
VNVDILANRRFEFLKLRNTPRRIPLTISVARFRTLPFFSVTSTFAAFELTFLGGPEAIPVEKILGRPRLKSESTARHKRCTLFAIARRGHFNMNQRLLICLISVSVTLIVILAPNSAVFPVLAARGPTISTIAGSGSAGFCGDRSSATSACLNFPIGVAVNGNNNLFIADTFNNRIRQLKFPGAIITVAGNGIRDFCGDDGPATRACLNVPEAVAVDNVGNLFIADTFNNRIRKVNGSGIITTVAGNGTADFCGDSGAATSACLNFPRGVVSDDAGNLFIADTFNHRVRRIAKGIITTLAGNGTPGFSGDNGAAISACLQFPVAVAVDTDGNVFITDLGNQRIRKIHRGTITTVAGNGAMGFCGDGGQATSACLSSPFGIAVDTGGNLFIADAGNQRIRQVGPGGTINTVAGNGAAGFCGDGGPATEACLNGPTGVALDNNDLFTVDQQNNRVRRVR